MNKQHKFHMVKVPAKVIEEVVNDYKKINDELNAAYNYRSMHPSEFMAKVGYANGFSAALYKITKINVSDILDS